MAASGQTDRGSIQESAAQPIDAAPELLARLAPDGTILFASAASEQLLGRSPREVVGTQALKLVDPADHAEATERLARIATAAGNEERLMLRLVRPGGDSIWAEISARTQHNAERDELEIVAIVRETTERPQAENELARIEERFRELVEWLPAVVYEAETGGEGAFHYISPQIADLLGYTPDEWLADRKLWRERIHPEDVRWVLEQERAQARESLETKARMPSEYRMLHRSGHVVWVRDVARMSTDAEGRSFWRGVLTDITAERGAHQALADAHERHRSMVEGLPACVYRAERRAMGQWHFVSAQIERLLGYTPEEWTADPTLWRASLHADDRERIEIEEERHLQMPPGTELVSEYRLRHRTGRPVWVRDRAVLSEAEGDELMIDGILTDISAERATAAAASGQADVYRLTCADCGQSWAAHGIERCPSCASQNVEGVSLNSALEDLAAARQQVEGLLDGIQKHLEALGTNLRTVSARIAPGE